MLKTYSRRRRQANKIISDVHELCRLCLAQAEEMVPIFTETNNLCAALPMRIMICVGLEIKQEDCLPNIICANCHQELQRYYKFRKKCEDSYLKLKSHFIATKLHEKFEIQLDNKIKNETQSFDQKLQEAQDEKQLVIADIYTHQQDNGVSDKTLISYSDLSGTNIFEKRAEETTEVQVIQQDNEESPDISSFLNAILVELGILVRDGRGLSLQGRGVASFELETGDDDHVVFELVEEDEEKDMLTDTDGPEPDRIESSSEVAEINTNEKSKAGSGKSHESKKTSGAWCPVCRRTFASMGAARRHRTVHSRVKPHACPDCGRTFAQRSVMQRHRLVHSEIRPFQCSCCSKSFTQRAALQCHVRSHSLPHSRPLALHACTHCDKMFLYASGLSRHMMTHNGRTFCCGNCERLFNDKSSLLRHRKTAHPTAIATKELTS